MKRVISENCRIPVKMWLDDLEPEALQQAVNLANLPFAFRHVALMPDSHTGYGMPIGGVLATSGVVIPNAVGVDIGCGMCALKTPYKEIVREDLEEIINEVKKVIPVGFDKHEELDLNIDLISEPDFNFWKESIIYKEWENAILSLGTLGGGNHFIEIQKGSDGFVWIMIHSGSRNLGKKVADHYNKIAIKLNEQWFSSVPKKWDLAFLPINTEEGKRYI